MKRFITMITGRSTRTAMVFLVLAATVGCDQSTKLIASNTLRDSGTIRVLGDFFVLRYTVNPGAFLGLGATWPVGLRILVFTVLTAVILAGLLYYALRGKDLDTRSVLAFSCIAGGGASNLLDRIVNNGYVVDFMNMGIGGLRTGVFNFADVFIMAGVAGVILFQSRGRSAASAESSGPAGPG